MQFAVENLKKHDNKKLKKIADYLLYTLPLYLGAILALPIPENIKLYINFAVTILIISMKGASKFSSEDNSAEIRQGEQRLDEIKQ
jgi:hypothetical protein